MQCLFRKLNMFFLIDLFYFIDTEKTIKDHQQMINKTLGLEIIGSDIITSDDIMIPSRPSQPNMKVSNR